MVVLFLCLYIIYKRKQDNNVENGLALEDKNLFIVMSSYFLWIFIIILNWFYV